tara:strand:+ start:3234 stop:3446 length:213 start_codon:yes stop_codon:yes gene_type:complete
MVIKRTRMLEVSIHAVSPVSGPVWAAANLGQATRRTVAAAEIAILGIKIFIVGTFHHTADSALGESDLEQ